jgi:hypothetical protein
MRSSHDRADFDAIPDETGIAFGVLLAASRDAIVKKVC